MSRAIVLVGHGSHLNPDSSAPVFQHARTLRRRGVFDAVHAAFWKEEPSLSRALDNVHESEVAIVPIFISTGYFTEQVIPREMGLSGEVTHRPGQVIRYTAPIGAHPSLAEVVTQRAREAGARPSATLAVLGHGTPRNPNSAKNVYDQSERVQQAGDFRKVVTVFLDQEPGMHSIFALPGDSDVVVVPLFIADGWHVGQTIPADLALDGPITRRDGRHVIYAAAVGTHPSIANVAETLATEAFGC